MAENAGTLRVPQARQAQVDQIDGPLIRNVLAEIWLDIPETARRLRQRIGTVLDWAYSSGFRATEAPTRSISKGLPRQPKRKGHFAALPHSEVPTFITSLRKRENCASRLALEAAILTATRSGAVRGAKWSELNEDLSLWTVPIECCKLNAINPDKWLADTLSKLANGYPANSDGDLMPWTAVPENTAYAFCQTAEFGLTRLSRVGPANDGAQFQGIKRKFPLKGGDIMHIQT